MGDILIAIKYFLNDRKIPHLFLDYSFGSIPLEDLLTKALVLPDSPDETGDPALVFS